LVSLHTIIALALLLSARDRVGALQLATASGCAFLLTSLTKGFIERPRPTAVPVLVEAVGSSYPSGHSLAAAAMYVTIAILACRHLPQFRQRAIVCALAVIVIAGVGVSRVYLGVHYATDALSGIALGTAWALALAGLVAMFEQRANDGAQRELR
jgi:undecaprenyl-diphosphatase